MAAYTILYGSAFGRVDAERAVRIVRRIHHWQQHVAVRRELLPLLSDLERAGHGRHESEDVGGAARTRGVHARARGPEELAERVRLRHAVRVLEHLLGKTLVRLGKADVVELHFAEAHLRHLDGHADVVFPDRVIVRIDPREPLLVVPRRAVGLPDHVLRIVPRRDRILERHEARDRQNVMRLQRVEQLLQVRHLPANSRRCASPSCPRSRSSARTRPSCRSRTR